MCSCDGITLEEEMIEKKIYQHDCYILPGIVMTVTVLMATHLIALNILVLTLIVPVFSAYLDRVTCALNFIASFFFHVGNSFS